MKLDAAVKPQHVGGGGKCQQALLLTAIIFWGDYPKAADPFSEAFISKASQAAKEGGQVLEIGAAYGVATLEALAKNATVFCNDIEPKHIAVVAKEHAALEKGKLIPVVGNFPEELSFQPEMFDAILISRVLHFFDGEAIIAALKKAKTWLKPQGTLFLVNETPFLANWHEFFEEYKQRKARGERWPGLIKDTQRYEQHFSFSLPPVVHWLDKDTLNYILQQAGFDQTQTQIEYINREGQFPPNLLIQEEQKESIGCKATK